MDDIILYMANNKWQDDLKGDRKRFLLNLAKESSAELPAKSEAC